jgi:hypothetical protein
VQVIASKRLWALESCCLLPLGSAYVFEWTQGWKCESLRAGAGEECLRRTAQHTSCLIARLLATRHRENEIAASERVADSTVSVRYRRVPRLDDDGRSHTDIHRYVICNTISCPGITARAAPLVSEGQPERALAASALHEIVERSAKAADRALPDALAILKCEIVPLVRPAR